MRKRSFWMGLVLLMVISSLVLSACATPSVDEIVEQAAAEAEEAAEPEAAAEEPEAEEEPAAEEEAAAEEPMGEADLDGAFKTFLGDMEGYGAITVDNLNTAMAEAAPFLLDVRQPEEGEENGYIEGTNVTVPLRELGQNLNLLPSFDTPIVVYCGSGWRSTIAMTALEALGWTDVKSMVGGFAAWSEAGYAVSMEAPANEVLDAATPDAAVLAEVDAMLAGLPEGWGVLAVEDLATELAESSDIILIDVRRPEELEENGQIEGAISIPLETFIDGKDLWPAEMGANIVVYCKAGWRGNIASTILRTYGYTNVRNLKGGFDTWVEAGNPVPGGGTDLDTAFQTFLDDMEGYGAITVDNLNTAMAEAAPFLLDVRQPEEGEENGYIEGTNATVPLRELGQNLNLLPSFDTPIVVYCGSGWRSTIAMTALEALGWTDVKSMAGGFAAWSEAGYAVSMEAPANEALDAATPDAAVQAEVDAMLAGLPEGWGVLAVEDLATELAESSDIILIDVRRPEEVEENGVIEGAINIPLEQFIELMDQWPVEMGANIVVYCKAGWRGNIASTILRTYGYTNVRNLKGGFDAWVGAGFEAIKPE